MVEFPGFDKVTFMQDMTSAQCYHAEIGETKQLVDKRDNKKYWVTKLKDGNCWMTQNLDYDDPDAVRVTSTSGTNGGPSSTEPDNKWVNDAKVRQYWDPGEKFVGEGENSGKLVDPVIKTEQDRHYLVGNYYSFLAATAGTGAGLDQDGQNATGSVCPEGWQLPTSGAGVVSSGSFGGLTTAYNIDNNAEGSATLQRAPLYFVRGGAATFNNLYYAGSRGLYRPSTVVNSDAVYYLGINADDICPSCNTGWRPYGHSVRCLLKS